MNGQTVLPGDLDAMRRRIAELEQSEQNLKQLLARQADELSMFRTLLDTMPDYLFDRLIEEVTITLESGDRFLLYTDGLTETIDPDNNFYGISRLLDRLSENGTCAPDDLIDRIMIDLNKFKKGCPFHDDLTILAMAVE